MIRRWVSVGGRRIEGELRCDSAPEEAGGAAEAEPRRAVFFGFTIAHANHGLTAVLAVQLPSRMLPCGDFHGRYRPRRNEGLLSLQAVVGQRR